MQTDVQKNTSTFQDYRQPVPFERVPVPVPLSDEMQIEEIPNQAPIVIERLIYVPVPVRPKTYDVSPAEILETGIYIVGVGTGIGIVVAFIIYPEAILILVIILSLAVAGWFFSLFNNSWQRGFDQSRHVDRVPYGGGNTQNIGLNHGNVQQNSGGDNRQYIFNNCNNVKIEN